MSNKKIAIIGSRNFPDLDLVREFVESLPDDITVVSGGARGVDITAEKAAKARGLKTEIYPADWDRLGKAAGHIRNVYIADVSDIAAAFYNKTSGTLHTISLFIKQGKPIDIHPPRWHYVIVNELEFWEMEIE